MDIHIGKCPHCKAVISKVRLEGVEVGTGPLGNERQYHGVSYSCPLCHLILSVSIDPISLKVDTVSEVAQALRRG